MKERQSLATLEKDIVFIEKELDDIALQKEICSKLLSSAKMLIKKMEDENLRAAERLSEIRESVDEKKAMICRLNKMVKAHKQMIYMKEREASVRKYLDVMDKVNSIDLSVGLDALIQLKNIGDVPFEGLRKRIVIIMSTYKSEFESKLKEKIRKYFEKSSKIHFLFYYLRRAVKYDQHFRENFLDKVFMDIFCEKFEYHFLSEKETNRPDKPEWFFEFLLSKLRSVKGIYETLSIDMKNLIAGFKTLIDIKVREIARIQSEQKANLMLHFADKFIAFSIEIIEKFGLTIDSVNLSECLIESESERFISTLKEIESLSFSQWWVGYKRTVNECVCLVKRYPTLNLIGVLSSVLEEIFRTCEVFIGEMRYVSDKEIETLSLFYNEIDDLVRCIEDEDVGFIISYGIRPSVDLQNVIIKFIRMNERNLSLLLSLVENDASCVLKQLRRFSTLRDKEMVSFTVDLSNILRKYEMCISFNEISRRLKSIVDSYIMCEIVMKERMESNRYLQLVEHFRNIRELFGKEEWKTSDGLLCLGQIFEGKKPSHGDAKIRRDLSNLYKANGISSIN